MKVLVTGAGGQLAWELERSKPENHHVYFCSRSDLDICDQKAVSDFIHSNKIEAIINAAAYTCLLYTSDAADD